MLSLDPAVLAQSHGEIKRDYSQSRWSGSNTAANADRHNELGVTYSHPYVKVE